MLTVSLRDGECVTVWSGVWTASAGSSGRPLPCTSVQRHSRATSSPRRPGRPVVQRLPNSCEVNKTRPGGWGADYRERAFLDAMP